jgi:glutathione synthase/RimK-type ligase-like ATP-grasp enzyme
MNRNSKFRVYPYKQGSRSAKQLAFALEGKVLKHVGSKFKPCVGDVVVNWGAGNTPPFGHATTLNADVSTAQCKLRSFKALREAGVRVPDFWEDKALIPLEAFPVVCRTKLRGHSGDGIVIADTPDDLVAAPLYVRYVKKKHEFRVHVFGGEVFFIQRKARRPEIENPDWRIRNLQGGFVFVKTDAADIPENVLEQAAMAQQALGVDFGGVDVIFNEKDQKAYVLELNTACGLETRTAEKYADKIFHHVKGKG